MNTKLICLFLVLIAASTPQDVGISCEEKAIINSDYSLTYGKYDDYDRIYHGVASCYSLIADDDNLCCYIKNKFKSEEADKKFTHKGCVQVPLTTLNEGKLDDFIGDCEKSIQVRDNNVTKVEIDIDCKSKYIKLTGLLLLAFLL